MKKAVIDVGTISIKFCIAQNHADKVFEILRDVNDIEKLGEALKETGRISPDSLERNAFSVAGFVKQARDAGAEDIVIVGTMALRTAENSRDFTKRVKELTDLDVKILSGEEEAQNSFIAVLYGVSGAAEDNFIMVDTGGGSTEFVFSETGVLRRRLSLNIGAMRLTEHYFLHMPVAEKSLAEAQAEIKRELVNGGIKGWADLMIGIGGNVTSMASVKHKMEIYDPQIIHGSKLLLSDIKNQIEEYASKTLQERRQIVGLDPRRADVILAGACIIKEVMELCGVGELTVSSYGLRHGIMYGLFKESSGIL